ncbi:MAG: AsmA family protein [Bacillota bacterium]
METEVEKKGFNFKKIVIYALIIMLVIASGAVLFLKSYFDGQRLQKLVIPHLEQASGRDVNISDIELQLWPRLGVAISNLEVANPQGFSEEYLARVDSFTIAVEILPLFQREIKAAQIKIDNPQFNLIKKEDGTTNYLLARKAKTNTGKTNNSSTSQKTEKENKFFNLDLDSLKIKNGVINYKNLVKGQDIKIVGFNTATKLAINSNKKQLITEGNLAVQEVKFQGSGFEEALTDDLSISLEQQCDFNWGEKLLTAQQFDLQLNDLDLKSDFELKFLEEGLELKNFKAQTADSNLNLNLLSSQSQIDFSATGDLMLQEFFNNLPFKPNYKIAGNLNTNLRGQFDLERIKNDLDNLELLGVVNFEDVAVSGEKVPVDITKGTGEIEINPQRIVVNEVQTNIVNSDFTADLQIDSWKKMIDALLNKEQNLPGKVELNLQAGKIDFKEWQQQLSNKDSNQNQKDGTADKSKSVDSTTYLPQLTMVANAQVEQLAYQNNTYQDVSAKLNLNNKQLELEELQIQHKKSNLYATAVMNNWPAVLNSSARAGSSKEGSIELNLGSNYLNLDNILAAKKSNNKQKSKEEKVKQDAAGDLSKLVPDILISGMIDIDKLIYNGLEAADITAKFNSYNDLIKILNLNLKTAQGEITGNGEVDLKAKKPRYNGDLKVSKVEINRVLSDFTQFKNSLYGGFNLDFNLSGTGLELKELLNSMTLQGELKVNDTKLASEKLNTQLTSHFNIFDKSELKLGDLKGKLAVKDGKLVLNKVKTVNNDHQVKLNGYATLGGKLNYKIDYLLSEQQTQNLDLKHKELLYTPGSKQVQLNFNLKGTTANPNLKWDKSELEAKLKEKAEQKIEEEKKDKEKKGEEKKEQLEDEAKDKLEEKKEELKDKLKDLWG